MKINKILGLVFLALFLGSISLGSVFGSIYQEDVLAYWTFDNLSDSSGNGYSLTNIGGATYSATGCKINGCYDFDGSNDYMTSSSNFLFGLDKVSVSIWYKLDANSSYRTLMSNWADYNFNMILYNNNAYAQFYGDLGVAGGLTSSGITGIMSTGVWNNLVYTWDGSANVKIYLNGVYKTTVTGVTPGNLKTVAHSLLIGNQNGFSRNVDGKIDEIGFFNKNLSASEVTSLYNGGNGISYNDFSSLISTPEISTPEINHNTQEFYNATNISINLNTTANTNISVFLDNVLVFQENNTNSTIAYINGISEGAHSILFVSTDNSGQENTTANFTIDTTVPIINLTNINNISFLNSNYVYFNWSIIDNNPSTCKYKIDLGSYISCTNSSFGFVNTTSLAAGNHSFTVNATDLASNINITTVNFTYTPYNVLFTFRSSLTDELLSNLTFYDVNFTNNITVNDSTLTIQHNQGTYNYIVYKNHYQSTSGTYSIIIVDNIKTIYLNPIFNITLKDEKTLGAFNISGTQSIYVNIICQNNSVFQQLITTQNFEIPVTCNYKKFKFIVSYISNTYYRTMSLDSNLLDFDIYLIDLLTTQSVFDSFTIYDLNNLYQNPQLRFYKSLTNSTVQITGDYIDAQGKVGAYLIFGDQYTLRIYSDNLPVRSIGFFSADNAADINLRLFDLNYQPTDGYYDGKVYLDNYYTTNVTTNVTTLFGIYNNLGLDTTYVTYSIYNSTKYGALLYTDTVLSSNNGSFSYNVPSAYQNYTFFTRLELKRSSITQATIDEEYLRPSGQLALGINLENINLDWLITIVLGTLALIFTASTATIGGIILLVIAAFFTAVGWYSISWVFISLGLVIGITKFIQESDKK